MAKHTLKQILGIFANHVGHTHEAAVQATYDAGHAQGRTDAEAAALVSAEAAAKSETLVVAGPEEVLAVFDKHFPPVSRSDVTRGARQALEAAVQATYDAGYDATPKPALDPVQPAAGASTAGEKTDDEENGQAAEGQSTSQSETGAQPAAGAQEDKPAAAG